MRQSAGKYYRLGLMITALAVCITTAGALRPQTELQEAADYPEETAIRKAVEELYIKGLQIRNFQLIQEVCIPEAKLMSTGRDGRLRVTTLEKWKERFDPQNPPFETMEAGIIKIDREGTAAQIKIRFLVDSKREVTDFLHMLKMEGQWRIVNIIDY